MKQIVFASAVLCALALSSCASSSITQLAKNRAMVSTSAAPICRTTGAVNVANQMAAIATIKQGYDRFIVAGIGAENNTRIVSTGPTHATTTGTLNTFGNTALGSSHTTFGGQRTFIAGSNDAQMEIVMLKGGDPGYENGLDARTVLGPEWQKKVEEGVASCL